MSLYIYIYIFVYIIIISGFAHMGHWLRGSRYALSMSCNWFSLGLWAT